MTLHDERSIATPSDVRKSPRPRLRPTDGGFTLLEVLIALVIAAAALGVLFHGALDGIRSARIATRTEEALELARSHLALNAAAPVPGEHQGDDGNGYRWQVSIMPIEAFGGRADTAPTARSTAVPVTLYAISVRVDWRDGNKGHGVRLDAERLFAAPLPPSPASPVGSANSVPVGR